MKHLKVGCMAESNWYKNEARLRLSFQNTDFEYVRIQKTVPDHTNTFQKMTVRWNESEPDLIYKNDFDD